MTRRATAEEVDVNDGGGVTITYKQFPLLPHRPSDSGDRCRLSMMRQEFLISIRIISPCLVSPRPGAAADTQPSCSEFLRQHEARLAMMTSACSVCLSPTSLSSFADRSIID